MTKVEDLEKYYIKVTFMKPSRKLYSVLSQILPYITPFGRQLTSPFKT